eukprot:7991314-Pyramimonas_sp.AAC.1
MVALIRHYNIAAPVHRHSVGAVELSGVALSVLIARLASARQRRHKALRRYLANTMITIVGHKNVTLPIHSHSTRVIELSAGDALSVLMARLASARQ